MNDKQYIPFVKYNNESKVENYLNKRESDVTQNTQVLQMCELCTSPAIWTANFT